MKTGVVILILAVVLLSCVGAALAVGLRPFPRPIIVRPYVFGDAIAAGEAATSNAWRSAMRLSAIEDVILMPAMFSKKEQGFLVRLGIGADSVLAVVDSGSSRLAVATEHCIQSNRCESDESGYRPNASPTVLRAGEAGSHSYGSLRVDTEEVVDTIVLNTVDEVDDACSSFPAFGVQDRTIAVPHIPVSAVHNMEGTQSNILGLSAVPNGTLHVITKQLRLPLKWALACPAHGRGWLTFGGAPRCLRPLLKHAPMSLGFSYAGTPVLDIVQFKMDGVPVSAACLPTHLLLDTGTAESYFSPASSGSMKALGLPSTSSSKRASAPTLSILLKNDVELKWDATHYMVAENEGMPFAHKNDSRGSSDGSESLRPSRSLFHEGDPRIETLFGQQPRLLLLGLSHMVDKIFEFNYQDNTVGIASI